MDRPSDIPPAPAASTEAAPTWRDRLALAAAVLRPGTGGAFSPKARRALPAVAERLDDASRAALLSGVAAGAPRKVALPPAALAGLGRWLAALPPAQAVAVGQGWAGDPAQWLPPVRHDAAEGGPTPQADGAALLCEAWLHCAGYAGLLAAVAAYLAVRPALDRTARDTDGPFLDALRAAALAKSDPPSAGALVAAAVLDGDRLHLDGAELCFPDPAAAWIVLHELVVRRAYDFTPHPDRSTRPRVIDGGAHFGLGVYAVKRRFPDAEIVAFEPDPKNRDVLEKNVRRNGWSGVAVEPHALAAERGRAEFSVLRGHSMAGSLTTRMDHHPRGLKTRTVSTRPLGDFLDGPVDFLKLDIEGSEAEVVADAAGPDGRGLDGVRNVFVEHHHGRGLPGSNLWHLLRTLDDAGFRVQLNKSFTAELGASIAPLENPGAAYALDVHGVRHGDPG